MALIRYLGVAGELGEGTTLGACPQEGQAFGILEGQAVFIGRGAAAHIRIESNRVAREHATMALMPGVGDRMVVTDLDATNGTIIDGEKKISGVLSPGQELVIAGLFRFRFEEGAAPVVGVIRSSGPAPELRRDVRPIAISFLVIGMLLPGVSNCTRSWFTDAKRKADIGLSDSRLCTDDGCETRRWSAYDDDRGSVFETMTSAIQVFFMVAAFVAGYVLFQLGRGQRATAMWFLLGMIALGTITGLVAVRLLPIELDGPDAIHVRWGPWVQWLGYALAIAAAVLLLRRPKSGNEAVDADVPGA